MASEGGKIKSKRRQAASKPYDRNLTLFGKLRKSVKELLIPSWLSGSYQQEDGQATGDTCLASQTSSLSQVEINSFSSGTQPYNRPGDVTVALDRSPTLILNEERGEQNIFSLSGRRDSTNVRERPVDHYPEPQTRADPVLRMSESYLSDDSSTEVSGAHSIMTSTRVSTKASDISQTVAKRQRLWSPEADKKGKYLASPVKDRPAFNSFLLGSQSDSAMLGDSFQKSVFYPGKTRFGGASAERRTSLNASLPYQSSLPLRKQVRAHTVSNSIHATTSATAQRILETLDKMSTPLGDAKKIPVPASPDDSVLTFTPSSYRRISYQTGRPVTRPLQLPSRAPPTSQHQVLAQAVIARNRHRSGVVDRRQTFLIGDEADGDENMSTSQQSTGLADLINPAVSTESRVNGGQQSGVTGKMKVKRFSQHISSTGAESDAVVEIPNLRTDFTLPVSNMGPISVQSHPVKSQIQAEVNIPSTGESVPLKFTFSAPIDEKRQVYSCVPGPADKSFKFTSPITTSHTKASAAGAEGESKTCQEPAVGASSGMPLWTSSAAFTASVPAWGSTAPKPKLSSPDIGGTSSSFKSYSKWGGFDKQGDSCAVSDLSGGFSLAPAASLKTGSVMDVLGGTKASAPGGDDLMAKFKKPAGSWECNSCMLVNKPEAVKCVCCETPRPGAKPSQSGLGPASSSSTASASAPTTNSASALSNKLQADTPATGEVTKPEAKQSQNGMDNSLSSLFKKPPGNWECDTCMVQNTAGALRCIACDSSKPGLQTAGIVSKPSVTSSGPSAISIAPTGGFTFNVSAMTTTTSGSGGFTFGNATSTSAPSTSVPAPTGFIFGQTISATKDSINKTSTGSTASTPLTGGFKFGGTKHEGDSGGTKSGTWVASSGSGFVFGNSSSNILPAKTDDNVLGFQSDDSTKTSTSIVQESTSTAAVSEPDVRNNGTFSTIDSNKSNSFVGIQFGSVMSTQVSTTVGISGSQQSGSGFDSKDSSTKTPQVNFNFAPSSAAPPSYVVPSQPLDKSEPTAGKPSSTLFQFGTASSIVSASSAGLGMGSSLSSSKPMVNGGFGSGFETKSGNDATKPASLDTSKTFGKFTFGSTPSVFGGFGQTPAASEPASGAVTSQTSQSSKRQVGFGDTDHSSAKKPFNFGSSSSEPTSNGLFALGAGSTAGSATGGFMFNSTSNPPATQTAGPASAGGFQFSMGSSTGPAQPGFNFSFNSEGPKASFEAPVNKGPIPFSSTPNFNFGGSASQPTSVFQFGAKPAENSISAPGLFAFGAAQSSGLSTEGSAFGTPTGLGTGGGFSIGAGDRKVRKATRRLIKK